MFNELRLQPYVWRAVRGGWLRPGSRRRLSRRGGPARPPPLPPGLPPCLPPRRARLAAQQAGECGAGGWARTVGRERWGAACPPPVPRPGPSRLTAAAPRPCWRRAAGPLASGPARTAPGDRLVGPGPRLPGLGDLPAALGGENAPLSLCPSLAALAAVTGLVLDVSLSIRGWFYLIAAIDTCRSGTQDNFHPRSLLVGWGEVEVVAETLTRVGGL